MKQVFFLIGILFLTHCSKPKTVYICGDHICINKAEAKQYFKENLSIEIKVIDKKKEKKIDLVELNLKESVKGKNQVMISSKEKTDQKLKTLSKNDIIEIKKKIKKSNQKKINIETSNKKIVKSEKINNSKIVNKNQKEVVDICTIIEKCSIDEISKYLINKGNKDAFPDITKRQ